MKITIKASPKEFSDFLFNLQRVDIPVEINSEILAETILRSTCDTDPEAPAQSCS